MRRLLVAMAVVLAGCAHDPTTLRAQGDIGLDLASMRDPESAASCLARKAAETHPLISAQRHGGDVYVYWQGALWGIAAITPSAGGSHVQLRVQPAMIVGTRDAVYDAMRGC